jgi:hypothetical protein
LSDPGIKQFFVCELAQANFYCNDLASVAVKDLQNVSILAEIIMFDIYRVGELQIRFIDQSENSKELSYKTITTRYFFILFERLKQSSCYSEVTKPNKINFYYIGHLRIVLFMGIRSKFTSSF